MKIDLGALPARIGKALQGVFGSANKRALVKYQPVVRAVGALSGWAKDLSKEQIVARVAEWRQRVQSGAATLDDALPEMFAMTREAAERTIGLRPFDVQVIGGAVLHDGKIAEMATGEGKTLVATLPAALNAISGKGVFVVTVNDYLAKRDRDWMAPVYEYLGLTVGAIQSNMPPQERLPHYGSDITYGTNNEFGFDYLRDNMKWRVEDQVQKTLNFAIVDEVDSILIDEARTPLIISGESEGTTERYLQADQVARKLEAGKHFEIKLKEHQCLMTDEGVARAEQLVGVESFYANPALMEWPHLLETALRAHHIYERDKHYVVMQRQTPDGRKSDPEIVIVDEFTGRLMAGRRWSDGLHQAVEAKEGIRPREENRTLATITLQNYFRMFGKLAGMTGTAMTEAAEFSRIYKLDVVSVPSNRPMIRKDVNDQIYLDENSKLDAIVDEIKREHERGRPILLGTTSIAKSERIAARLAAIGVPHNVLNAKHHEREAEIIMQAGRRGTVTVATNMAGRGTDIVLGGKAEALWRAECLAKGLAEDQPEAKARLQELLAQCKQEHDQIIGLGGLYVIGTERHEARRIDNQLRGRCGRQGDPGETRFFLSFDDDLMKIFARDWVKTMMEKMGLKAGEVIDSPMVTRGIARAQKKVEARNFDIRKHLLEYDEVMDKQRKFLYGQRQEVLEWNGLREKVVGMFEEVFDPVLETHAGNKDEPVAFEELRTWLQHKCGGALDLDGIEQVGREQLFDWVMERVEKLCNGRQQAYGEKEWDGVQRFLLVDTMDNKWKDHLHAMEVLKAGIGLRSYAQVDPKNEYKKEGFEKFQQLKAGIAEHVTSFVFKHEATDTIRDLITGRLRQQAPPPMPVPRTPQEAAALLESLIAAGQVPKEIVERMQKGERFVLSSTPRGLVLQPAAPPPGDGQVGQTPGPAGGQRPAGPASGAPRAGAQQPAPQGVAAAVGSRRLAPARPANAPKPGRNDPCPCGSGISTRSAARRRSTRGVRMGDNGSGRAAVPPRPRLRSWLALLLYQFLFLCSLAAYVPVLGWRWLFDRRFRRSLPQRMGFVDVARSAREVVWIHGVSVGEVKAARNIVARLRTLAPGLQIVLSSTTPNGHQVARQEHPDLQVVYYPLDFGRFPARALDRVGPRCVLLMELEIWPNFLQAAARRGIPVAVINGRISERTFRGYRRARGLLPQLDLIEAYCVQDNAYLRRLLDLGVDPARVVVTGNMKYDTVVMQAAGADGLRQWLAPDGRLVVVAGSTHADEESWLGTALAQATDGRPDGVRLVLVPRHPERAESVCEAMRAIGREPVRWSETGDGRRRLPRAAVLVVDTIGQLQRFYRACDLAFVGGSLIPHGGQNMLEPAALGCAVLFGPHTFNFRTDVELLLGAGAVVRVQDRAQLAERLRELLATPEQRQELGERARRVIAENQGATLRTLLHVAPLLGIDPNRIRELADGRLGG